MCWLPSKKQPIWEAGDWTVTKWGSLITSEVDQEHSLEKETATLNKRIFIRSFVERGETKSKTWEYERVLYFFGDSGISQEAKMWGKILHTDVSYSAYNVDFSGTVNLEDPIFGSIPTKLSPWPQCAHKGLNPLKRIWKNVALYRGCVETTREIWRGFSLAWNLNRWTQESHF